MNSIIVLFLLSFTISLCSTPLVSRIAKKLNIVDEPSGRKVHLTAIPRIGGVALYLAFFLSLLIAGIIPIDIFHLISIERQFFTIIIGASICFGVGLWDDIKGLPPLIKLLWQIVAAGITFWGGTHIHTISTSISSGTSLDMLSLPVTVFWIVLVINAINLIDGLDGLAAGVSLFISIVMLLLCVLTGKLLIAIGFAAVTGATLGFLRYNFNPATIFMGDCGSYFLGYIIAVLSIMGAIKGQTAVAMLIPVIAIGIPLMDTLLAPVRRFLLGQKMFSPDRHHFHHKLLAMGFTHRNAVLILYTSTVFVGLAALFIVHAKDDRAALILLLLGVCGVVGVRKLGYMDYLATEKVLGWFRDVSDQAGFSQHRRSFLNLQIQINQSKDIVAMWNNISTALTMLKFDMAELYFNNSSEVQANSGTQMVTEKSGLFWERDGFNSKGEISEDCLMKLELPLLVDNNSHLGTLWLIKDLKRDPITHYTLRRVEHLRRTVIDTLLRLTI